MADFQAFIRLFGWIMIVFLPLAAYESVTGGFLIPKIIDAIPGVSSIRDVNYERRLGLDRARVVFVHPIHFGFYCSLGVACYFVGLYNNVDLRKRVIFSSIFMMNCFFSLSSGAVLAAAFQVMLIAYWLVTKSNVKQWKILLIVLLVLYVILEIMSTNPVLYAIASRLSFNSWTSYYRLLLFQYGVEQISMTSIFGIGYNKWELLPHWMTNSIDNFWLYLGVVNGVPTLFFLAAAFINSLVRAGGGRLRRGSDLYNARVGWSIGMVSIAITLSTVAIWGEMLSMILFMLGAGGFFFYATESEDAGVERPAARQMRRRAVFGDERPADDGPGRAGERPAIKAGGKRTVF